MRVHVSLTPAEFPDAPLTGCVALAVDVLRATTASVAACDAGCRRLVPVPDATTAEALAALTNVTAAARWALEQGRDVTILCAGDNGAFSLEDAVCAGLLVARLTEASPAAVLSEGAQAALGLGRHYEARLERLAEDSGWGRKLERLGRAADLAWCLRADVSRVVPVFVAGGFVPRPAASTAAVGSESRT